MTDIFISYSRNDREQVRHIAGALEAEGFNVWWDPDIPPGESFSNVIDRQLKEAACILVVWSTSSIGSNWVQEEADDGMTRNTLVPVMIDDIDLPRGFKRLQTADLRGWQGDTGDANWQLIIAQVKKLVAAKSATQAAERQAEARSRGAAKRASAPPPRAAAAQRQDAKKGGFSLMPVILGLSVLGAAAIGYFFYAKSQEGAPLAVAAGPAATSAPSDDADAPAPDEPAPAENVELAAAIGGAGPDTVDAATDEIGEAPQLDDATDVQAAAPVADAVETPSAYAAGDSLRDCDECPELIVIASGAFAMGAPDGERSREASETPQVDVAIAAPFAMGAYEVTFDEWRACVDDGGCSAYEPPAMGWGEGRRPVVNVSFDDAQQYADWLSQKTGETYRLPSESEWEYAARAGSSDPFSFGANLSTSQANYNGTYPYADAPAGRYRSKTTEVGSFRANAFGLYDMHGNVWELVADCWRPNHNSAPADGTPVGGACSSRVLKGGAWNAGGWRLRAAHRKEVGDADRDYDTGFRLVREL